METVLMCELGNLSFTNKMLVLAEVMQEPRAEYYITLDNGQVHVEHATVCDIDEEEYVIHGLAIIHALRDGHLEGEDFHEIYIYQTKTHWQVTGTSYRREYQFLLDAGYQGKEYVSFVMEGRPLAVRKVSQWEVDHAIKLCKEYREGSVTEDKVVTPYCQFRKEDGVWRKYE